MHFIHWRIHLFYSHPIMQNPDPIQGKSETLPVDYPFFLSPYILFASYPSQHHHRLLFFCLFLSFFFTLLPVVSFYLFF